MVNKKADTHFNHDSKTDFAEPVRLDQQELSFDARLRRCYRILHFIACRVLGGPERADEAVGNCWRRVSRHPQRFRHEGEFRRWLVRILIDEALVLLRENVPTPTPKVSCEPLPVQASWSNDVFRGKGELRTDDQDQLSQDLSMALEPITKASAR